jgi:hypothetical protein
MIDFAHATEYDAHMYEKLWDLIIYRILYINTSSFDFLKFSTEEYCILINWAKSNANIYS